MKLTVRALSMWVLAGLAAPALAQDSTSINSDGGNGLPGDAFFPWNAGSPSQRASYVLDLAPILSRWNGRFAVGPVAKTSKVAYFTPLTNPGFFNSLSSGNGLSPTLRPAGSYASPAYARWTAPTAGINPTENNNSLVSTVTPSGEGVQLGWAISEFGTDDFARSHNGLLSGVINLDPAHPRRLYVTRWLSALVNPTYDAGDPLTFGHNAQLGFGAVDSVGNVYYRADNNNPAGSTPGVYQVVGNNLYRTFNPLRNPAMLNVISHPLAAPFGVEGGSTVTLLSGSTTTHNVPTQLPAAISGLAFPMIAGTNFDRQFYSEDATVPNLTGTATYLTTAHRPGTTDHRGNPTVTQRTALGMAPPGTVPGTFAIMTRFDSPRCNAISLWRVDTTGAVTRAVTLVPPRTTANPATPNDVCLVDGFQGEIGGYRGSTAFRGNQQVAVGRDSAGRGLVAATIYRAPATAGDTSGAETRNAVIVGRFDPGHPDLGIDPTVVQWSVAAKVDRVPDIAGGTWVGTDIYADTDGDRIGDTVIGNLINRGALSTPPTTGTTDRISISSPAFDSKGNLYFTASCLVDGVTRMGLIRGIYDGSDPAGPRYRLDLILRSGQVFAGQNSGTNYQIQFFEHDTSTSISPAAMGANSVNQAAFNNLDPATLAAHDERTMSGLVFAAKIVYDTNGDGLYQDPTVSGGVLTSPDEAYQVLMYVGPDEITPTCCVDYNNDFELDFSDIEQFLAAYNAQVPGNCAPGADLNNDGEFDFSDIETFIALYNAGCVF